MLRATSKCVVPGLGPGQAVAGAMDHPRAGMGWGWGSGEARTSASCPWWGHPVQHCPELPPAPVRLGSFEVSLLPLALQACLTTLTLEWLQSGSRLSEELLRFLPHHSQTSPPFHSCHCHSGNKLPPRFPLTPCSVGLAPRNSTGQSLSPPPTPPPPRRICNFPGCTSGDFRKEPGSAPSSCLCLHSAPARLCLLEEHAGAWL
jgi:hypothetical protein